METKVQCKCIRIKRNPKGIILGYVLMDKSGKSKFLLKNKVKELISKGDLVVSTLTLTSDGRLVKSQNKNNVAKSFDCNIGIIPKEDYSLNDLPTAKVLREQAEEPKLKSIIKEILNAKNQGYQQTYISSCCDHDPISESNINKICSKGIDIKGYVRRSILGEDDYTYKAYWGEGATGKFTFEDRRDKE